MNSGVYLSKHFKQRGKERLSKSQSKVEKLANEAYILGGDCISIRDEDIRDYIIHKERFGCVCKVYRGFLYWFRDNVAVTVYPIYSVRAY